MPVLDAEDRLVGILTEADFMSAMNLEAGIVANALETLVRKRRVRKGMGTIVDDIMTREPITIRADGHARSTRSGGWTRTRSSGSSSPTANGTSAASSRAPTW